MSEIQYRHCRSWGEKAPQCPQLLQSATHQEEPKQAAVQIHNFVRDSITFGWDSGFYDRTAVQVGFMVWAALLKKCLSMSCACHLRVLGDGRGFCLSKSTLFVALLRCVGIPSRVVFVDIATNVLHGILGGGQGYVDHSYVEVLLPKGNADVRTFTWQAVDSFVMDSPVFDLAMARVRREQRVMGYGVHSAGTSQWDGGSDALCQFVAARGTGDTVCNGDVPCEDVLPTRGTLRLQEYPHITSAVVEPIVSDDVKQFYEDALEGGILPVHLPCVRLQGLLKFFFGWVVWPANAAVEKLRAEAAANPKY